MNVSSILLGVWLILVGINWAGWVNINLTFLGIFAFVVGIIVIAEGAGVAPWRKA